MLDVELQRLRSLLLLDEVSGVQSHVFMKYFKVLTEKKQRDRNTRSKKQRFTVVAQ